MITSTSSKLPNNEKISWIKEKKTKRKIREKEDDVKVSYETSSNKLSEIKFY